MVWETPHNEEQGKWLRGEKDTPEYGNGQEGASFNERQLENIREILLFGN